jgi:hypothetical protein
MPLRTVLEGRISPSHAALVSAEVANAVVDPLLESRAAWRGQGVAFCIELKERIQATFKGQYEGLGARVQQR